MNWTFKLRGEEVALTIAETLTAVRPPTNLENVISPEAILEFGALVADQAMVDMLGVEFSISDQQVFQRAGWRFVEPHPEVAFAAEFRSALPSARSVRQVYVTPAGDLLLGTDLATVRLPDNLSEAQTAQLLKEDALEIVYRLNLGPNTNSFEVRLPPQRSMPEMINRLQDKTDRYIYAEPSLLQVITGRDTPNDENFKRQWQHDNDGSSGGIAGMDLRSLEAWKTTRGSKPPNRPARIAIIDNGMEISHPDLQAGIIGGGFFKSKDSGEADFIPLQPGMTGFPEANDHGTFCMGMAGARMNNGIGGCGSAPEADLIAIACLEDQTGTQTTLARAIKYAVDPSQFDPKATTAGGADVISCSLDTKNILTSGLGDAIDFASKGGREGLGVPILWAVSNKFVDIALDKLCSHANVIAVGRYNRQGGSDHTAFGPKLEFLAPGTNVFSTRSGKEFDVGTGTSFATPLAAGVAALILSIHPGWTADQVRQKLRDSCEQIGGADGHHDDLFGFGLLRADRAVK